VRCIEEKSSIQQENLSTIATTQTIRDDSPNNSDKIMLPGKSVNASLYDIMNLGFQHNLRDAVLFYVAYLIAGSFLGGVVGFLLPPRTPTADIIFMTSSLGVIYVAVIGFLIITAKNKLSAPNVLFVCLGIILSIYIGPLLGLLPVAYLSTLPKTSKKL